MRDFNSLFLLVFLVSSSKTLAVGENLPPFYENLRQQASNASTIPGPLFGKNAMYNGLVLRSRIEASSDFLKWGNVLETSLETQMFLLWIFEADRAATLLAVDRRRELNDEYFKKNKESIPKDMESKNFETILQPLYTNTLDSIISSNLSAFMTAHKISQEQFYQKIADGLLKWNGEIVFFAGHKSGWGSRSSVDVIYKLLSPLIFEIGKQATTYGDRISTPRVWHNVDRLIRVPGSTGYTWSLPYDASFTYEPDVSRIAQEAMLAWNSTAESLLTSTRAIPKDEKELMRKTLAVNRNALKVMSERTKCIRFY